MRTSRDGAAGPPGRRGVADASVVVPVHNAAATLAALLDSLIAQDCDERFEVVVSDDGSKDGSVDIARGFAGRLPLVVHRAARRRGSAAARNAGAARAGADVIVFCDADDVVDRAWLRQLCAAVRNNPLVAGAVHHLAAGAAAVAPSGEAIDPDALTAYFGHLPWGLTANLAVRRDAFALVGGFAEELQVGADADLCWRLAAQDIGLEYEPTAVVFKRHRTGALRTFRQYLAYGLGHPQLFRSHRDAGMPRRSLRGAGARYRGTARCLGRAVRHPRSPVVLEAAARLGQDAGRIAGSVRWRALYL